MLGSCRAAPGPLSREREGSRAEYGGPGAAGAAEESRGKKSCDAAEGAGGHKGKTVQLPPENRGGAGLRLLS